MKFPTYEKWGEKVAEQAIDVYLINGRTIREWIEILSDELTMFDKIRAELTEEKESYEKVGNWKKAYGFEKSIEIIEQYVKGESE